MNKAQCVNNMNCPQYLHWPTKIPSRALEGIFMKMDLSDAPLPSR